MTDAAQTTAPDPEELKALWYKTQRKRHFARRCITLLLLGVVAVHVGLLWATVKDFRHNRIPDFAAAMSAEAANISPRFVADLQSMLNRLNPHYMRTFENMFVRDWPKMKETALREMRQLDVYARQRWPQIEAGINDLVVTSEEVAREELAKFATPEDVKTISVAYGKALHEKYEVILTSTLKDHAAVAEDIGENLEKMIETEPDIQPPVEMQEAVGILLELAGLELQQGL
ncbi:MAG: hypothetical protein JXR37_32745 [Kiritimatiellae bacterium]|nr:hypothetical protein [Kiritimatiellia bacterium]